MNIEITEALWLDEQHELSLAELAEMSGLTADELHLLVECDALVPVANPGLATAEPATEARFSAGYLTLTRVASRLRQDFDLDVNALVLTLQLLKRIHELEVQVRALHAQRPS